MQSTGTAVGDLADFADKKLEDGTMEKSRFIYPSWHSTTKWFWSIFKHEDSDDSPSMNYKGANVVFVGDGFARKKDPEHLPPTNRWQRVGNSIKTGWKFFGSEESFFGFRVAVATMSIGVMAYIQQTQVIFNEYRFVWAMFMITFGMSKGKLNSSPRMSRGPPDYLALRWVLGHTNLASAASGTAASGFVSRLLGTAFGMVLAIINWYIVNGNTAGVIVILWFFIFVQYYLFCKQPKLIPFCLISIISTVGVPAPYRVYSSLH